MTTSTRKDWFHVALSLLETEGATAVKVDRMADALGISRQSFYNYFPERRFGFDRALVKYWRERSTTDVVVQVEAVRSVTSPKGRLYLIAEMMQENRLHRWDAAMPNYVAGNPELSAIVAAALADRESLVADQFAECGFAPKPRKMRTELFVAWISQPRFVNFDVDQSKRERYRKDVIDVLVK